MMPTFTFPPAIARGSPFFAVDCLILYPKEIKRNGLRLRRWHKRPNSHVAKPNLGTLGFQENASAFERDHACGILRVGLLDVPSGVDDSPVNQVLRSISLENHFYSVPAGAILEVAGLQDAAGVSGQTADPSAGRH